MNVQARVLERTKGTGAGTAQSSKAGGSMDDLDQRERPGNGQVSVIGADIVVTGNIEASVDLHIEGKVNGDVRCATLILGENSAINGSIYCDRVRVSGTVDGAVETKDLAIEATARVTGDITYQRLRVANGGVLEGNIRYKAPEPGSAEDARLKLVEPQTADEPSEAIFIE